METKKISFGFSKINKKPNLLAGKNVKNEETQVELIKCLEGQEIQLVEKKKEAVPLVIPLLENTKTSAALASLLKRRAVLLGEEEEEVSADKTNFEQNSTTNGTESVEERAARELLAEARANGNATTIDNKLVLAVPKPDELPLEGAKEPTQNDYEDIPVEQFGFAMLRGMGWVEPPKSKSSGVVIDDGPFVRPRGMGLGADKALKPRPLLIPPEANEKLEIKKLAYVRILGGKHKDAYGQIEGFDDDRSRVIVKMAIGGTKDSFNEFLCQPVSKKEFMEYGKCINTVKYEEYKRMENDYGVRDAKHKDENRSRKKENFTEKNYIIKKEIKNEKIEWEKDERDTKTRYNHDKAQNNKRHNEHSDRRRRDDDYVSRDREDRNKSKSEQEYLRRNTKQQNYESRDHRERREHKSRDSPAHYSRAQRATSVDKQSTDSSVSSDDSDSAYERRSLHKSQKSKKNKKSSKRSKSRRKSPKNDYSDDGSSNESEELRKKSKSHHKKKTKKSKKPRSRSRSRSRERK